MQRIKYHYLCVKTDNNTVVQIILAPVPESNQSNQSLKKLWNFEARACIGLQKNLDFINKNVRLN